MSLKAFLLKASSSRDSRSRNVYRKCLQDPFSHQAPIISLNAPFFSSLNASLSLRSRIAACRIEADAMQHDNAATTRPSYECLLFKGRVTRQTYRRAYRRFQCISVHFSSNLPGFTPHRATKPSSLRMQCKRYPDGVLSR